LLVHGYLDHSGLLTPLIRRCVADGYAVVAFDLPGHGLSSGTSGAIDAFTTYGRVIDELLGTLGPQLPRPLHAVGHSTGCAALYEHLRGTGGGAFGRLVFLAPLVRSAYWHLSRAGHALAAPFLASVPRQYRENSSDPGYLAEVRADPLRIEELPLGWVGAHKAWYAGVLKDPPVGRPLLVVQGTADDVVDWEFNLEFLRARFSPAVVLLVPEARHQLIHERLELRTVVLDAVSEYLNGYSRP
jgi:alpha-beta hydrolase superfamily lysophospholipase